MIRRKKYLTTGDIARYCEVDINTVKNWIKLENLRAFKTPSGHFRITIQDFKDFLIRNHFPVEDNLFSDYEKGIDILVVDDDIYHNQLLRQMIEQLGNNEVIAECRDEFDGYYRIIQSKPRLTLLDINGSGMTGIELIKKIHSNPEINTHLVVILNKVDELMNETLHKLGVTEIIVKPINISTLENILSSSINNYINRP
ncbi:MAG: response regulator [Fidelibacterota bacterium]